jgi:hypothetical protein
MICKVMAWPISKNRFPENRKIKKSKTAKEKRKNIAANQPPPQALVLSSYNFF